jgi:hypothetical protein
MHALQSLSADDFFYWVFAVFDAIVLAYGLARWAHYDRGMARKACGAPYRRWSEYDQNSPLVVRMSLIAFLAGDKGVPTMGGVLVLLAAQSVPVLSFVAAILYAFGLAIDVAGFLTAGAIAIGKLVRRHTPVRMKRVLSANLF